MCKNYLKSGKIAAILKQDRADEGEDPDGAHNDDTTTFVFQKKIRFLLNAKVVDLSWLRKIS